jgi:hypothetical protein
MGLRRAVRTAPVYVCNGQGLAEAIGRRGRTSEGGCHRAIYLTTNVRFHRLFFDLI